MSPINPLLHMKSCALLCFYFAETSWSTSQPSSGNLPGENHDDKRPKQLQMPLYYKKMYRIPGVR